MAAFNFRRRQTRRWWVAGVTMVVLAAGILLLAASASGTLPGGASTFNTGNGDLTTISTTIHDWNPAGSPTGELGPNQTITCPSAAPGSVAGGNCALDLVGSSSDNALGQGTKEDDVSPTIVDGSIPPNKDDLSRFYINQEVAPATAGVVTKGDNLLYLAWERTNLLGSAHMDFELNQNPVGITASTSGTVTINRTAGDVLIDFDFGGSGTPALQYHKWETSTVNDSGNASADCAASTTYPCWGKAHDIGAAGEATVNGTQVKDYNAPVPTAGYNTLSGSSVTKNHTTTVSSTFGEAAIDLQAAGIFSSFQCSRFGDAWLKSRSSGSSFVSELKDFIAPLPVSISNCGEIKIIKKTDPRNLNNNFSYSTNVPSGNATNAATFSTTPDSTGTTTAFTLNDRSDVTITAIASASSTTTEITTNKAYGLSTGQNVTITGSDSAPVVDGTWPVTVIDSTHFTIPFALNTPGTTGSLVYNTEDITDVVPNGTNGAPATYTVAETVPSGWSLEDLSCTASTGSSGLRDGTTSTADITVVSGGLVTCTYKNLPELGAILVTKQAKDHNCADNTTVVSEGTCVGTHLVDLASAKFQVWSESNGCTGLQTAVSTCNGGASTPADTQVGTEQTTGSDGTTCFGNLSWASTGTPYYVIESGAPSGFANDNAAGVTRTVTQNAKCTDSTIASEAATWTATDNPLTNLTVTVSSALAHATNSSISCVVHGTTNNIGNSPVPSSGTGDPETMNANASNSKQLEPGTYDCQIVIDP